MAKVLTDTEKMDALQQSETLLGSIIHFAMDAIIVIDEDQRIMIFNPAAETMFQCTADRGEGKTPDNFDPGAVPFRAFGGCG